MYSDHIISNKVNQISLYPQWKQDLKYAKKITHKHAKSFSAGIKFFPKEIREATYALYAFVRIPDDIVDERNLSDEEAELALSQWIQEWENSNENDPNCNPIFRMMKYIIKKYDIPKYLIDDFFSAMIQDTRIKRYHTYKDLKQYMHGSAMVVGEIMAIILGVEKEAYSAARTLGEAYQLTNFLRDINEDYIKRNRIYIPEELLIKYGSSYKDIENKNLSPEFIDAIKNLIEHNKFLYVIVRQGIKYLDPKSQFGIILATKLYGSILTQIEKENYNLFKKRIYLNKFDKLKITIKAIYDFKFPPDKLTIYYY